MKRFLALFLFFGLWQTAVRVIEAGAITCSATCLSKLASVVSIAANGKSIVAGAKRVKHAVVKGTKSTAGKRTK